MTTINRKVIDIYHGNSVNSWSAIKAAGILGVIHKATEGTANVDSKYADRKIQALNTGLLWGAYHFAHAGNVQAQVDHFLSVAGIDDQTLYALDWEDTPAGTMALGEAHQFLQLVDQKVGANRCVVYSGNVAKEKLGGTRDAFFGAHRLWLAQYSSAPSVQVSWDKPWLWQYSDGSVGPQPHSLNGVDGAVDSDSWDGTDTELLAGWSGVAGQVVTPPAVHDVAWLQTILQNYGYNGRIDGNVGVKTIAAMIAYVEKHEGQT